MRATGRFRRCALGKRPKPQGRERRTDGDSKVTTPGQAGTV